LCTIRTEHRRLIGKANFEYLVAAMERLEAKMDAWLEEIMAQLK
jgi:hypothetical protein